MKIIIRLKNYNHGSSLEKRTTQYFRNIVKYISFTKICRITFLFIILLINSNVIYSQTLTELFEKFDDYFQLDDFEKALKISEQALKKAANDFGNNSMEYATALHKRAKVYYIYADYTKAEKFYTDALEITESVRGTYSGEYSDILLDLARLQSSNDKYKLAEKDFLKVIDIRKKKYPENHPSYLDALERTAYFYFDYYEYARAERIYKEAYRIIMNQPPEKISKNLLVISNFAVLYEEQKKYDKAIPILKEILRITEITEGKKQQSYINTITELCDIYIKLGLYDETEPLISESINITVNDMNDYFDYISEESKMSMIESMMDYSDLYYSVGLKQKEKNKNLLKEIFNYRISTKGEILASEIGLRNKASKYKDEYLIERYNDFLKLKSELALCYTLSAEEQKSKGLDVKPIEKAVDSIAYLLYISFPELQKERAESQIRFEDIKKSLNPDEAAIDYINFIYSDKDNTDSIYCAFLIIPENEYPELIKLCSYSELNKIIFDGKDYYKEFSKLSTLYDLLIYPLEKYFGNKSKIYISPSGLLNKISFASMKCNDKAYLSDKYKISYMLNLNEIVSRKESQGKSQIKDAVLFGGINYTPDSSTFINAARNTRGELEGIEFENTDLTEYLKNNLSRGKGIPFLKGTLDESQSINNILNNSSIKTTLYSGNNGTEEAFKSLTGNNSPSLIHIATHGFYFPEPESKNKNLSDKRQTKSIRGNYKINSNPLIRSGLLFAGADFIWNEGKRFQGVEDGILTAYEVTCMDLTNTELVVLSACETGLGDIKNSEGVFGLNRAFKIAGVKNIILSLWQVPDKETGELMNSFYKFWIQDKMTIEAAFSNAQKELKQKYNEAFYWSAFILI